MKIFDTLSKSKKKLNQPLVSIYACGPTIYDDIHIGNARPIILTDTLIRFLEYKKIEVNYLHNITDIDDKIIKKAIDESKDEIEITSIYKQSYFDNLKALKIREPNKIVIVSEKINMMKHFIDNLINIKAAYLSDGDIYFDINKYKNEYGKLSNNSIDELIAGNRVETVSKNNKLDFSLWKKTKQGINWKFLDTYGRPGWHTECVAFINDYFKGETIDIHIGGIDLQFPHHENERIQFMALHNKELSNIWMHNGHLTVNDIKMSKSLNNTIYVHDFIQKYSMNTLRWIFLSTHYKAPISITNHVIDQGAKFDTKIINLVKKIKQSILKKPSVIKNKVDKDLISQFEQHMENDLNTPLVITLIENIITSLNQTADFEAVNEKYNSLCVILNTLGFDFNTNLSFDKQTKILFDNQQKLIKEKKFNDADEIRKELVKKGVY